MKRLIAFILILSLLTPISFADGTNVNSGGGSSGSSAGGHGYYLQKDYMYKITFYLAKSDKVDIKTSDINDFYQFGDSFYITTNQTKNLFNGNEKFSLVNKFDYFRGHKCKQTKDVYIMTNDNLPPPPVLHSGGSLSKLKKFFGSDDAWKNFIIKRIKEDSQFLNYTNEFLKNHKFIINNEKRMLFLTDIISLEGSNSFPIPTLILFEPVVMIQRNSDGLRLCFSATDLVDSSTYKLKYDGNNIIREDKEGKYNYRYKTGLAIEKLVYALYPSSAFLDKNWFSIVPYPHHYRNNQKWRTNHIMDFGGFGLRFFTPTKDEKPEQENPTQTSGTVVYRTDTDVITSVKATAMSNIYPTNALKFVDKWYKEYCPSAHDTYARVSISTSTGKTKTMKFALRCGDSEYAYIKWHTPKEPCNVSITFTSSSGKLLFDGAGTKIINASVVDLKENTPPDPKPRDTNNSFKFKEPDISSSKDSASWSEHGAKWNGGYSKKYVWEWVSYSPKKYKKWTTINPITGKETKHKKEIKHKQLVMYCMLTGKWGWWTKNYNAYLSADINIIPNEHVPTAIGKKMKSGYGFNQIISSRLTGTFDNHMLTHPQSAISYFPEFYYKTYNRVLKFLGGGNFEFNPNKYSTFNSKSHFTPLWYPNGKYIVLSEIFDVWTPAGMLNKKIKDEIVIEGNVYEDWHIKPK